MLGVPSSVLLCCFVLVHLYVDIKQLYQCLYTTILAREVDFSKMKKDSLKISKLRTSGGGGGGGGGVRDLGHLRTRGGLKVAKF